MAVNKLNPSAGGIPYGNTAGRPANPGVGRLYSNGELQRLELYTGATYGWQNIVAETPGVTGYTGTVVETNSTNTITITGTNFSSGATATLIGTDGTEYNATSTTVNNLTSITATFNVISASNEPYDIRVTNPSNLYGVYYDVLTVNDKPAWTTAAGSLGSFNEGSSISVTVAATDEENNTITYSLAAGSSLPSGITLNSSTGVISGTLPDIASDTTYTFTINASDGLNTSQSRVFSITSIAAINVEYLIVAGGGGGSSIIGGGGGGGGVLSGTMSLFKTSTFALTVGEGGRGGLGYGAGHSNEAGFPGFDSILNTLTATGGGGTVGWDTTGTLSYSGQRPWTKNGGSGGGGSGANGNSSSPGYPNSTGGTGITGQGYAGGNASDPYGAGGGGAGGPGGTQSSNGNINGGIGVSSSITGTSTYYGGGGGGGYRNTASQGPSSGGQGGGGQGMSGGTFSSNQNGTANTGGGGGGGNYPGPSTSAQAGGNGGSGVVIIAYPNTISAITNIPGTLTYDQPTRSGYRVYRFTAGTGTITF